MHCNHCSWLPYALQSLFLISIFITILVPDFQMHPIPYCSLPDALQSVFLISICIQFIIVHYRMHYDPCSWFPDASQSWFITICITILVPDFQIYYNPCSWFPYASQSWFFITIYITILVPDFQMYAGWLVAIQASRLIQPSHAPHARRQGSTRTSQTSSVCQALVRNPAPAQHWRVSPRHRLEQ